MDADWDLLAVVRGCTPSTTTTSSAAAPSSSPAREPPLLAPTVPTTAGGFEEFAYEPLIQEKIPPLEFDYEELQQSKQPQQQQQQMVFRSNPPPKEHSRFIFGSATTTTTTTSVLCSSTTSNPPPPTHHQRSKKRKNLQKRVCHVGAEGLCSDMWAWRKYGQKPIKGSPYPRGYYRCSSSKGCVARKQVERNRSDPKMFIITYTSEHNHPMPTHRNSLAGSTRHKPPAAPITKEEEEIMEFKDMVMNDDFFVGFEELDDSDGGDLDFFPDHIQGS